jgi:UDP-N-acetylmuramyl pentapeptide synthase
MDAAQVVIFVGSEAHMVRHVEDVPGVSIIRNFPTIRAAGEFLRATIQPGDLILVKASGFADHLERLVMDHQEPVRCWRQKCGLPRTCRACGLVRAP